MIRREERELISMQQLRQKSCHRVRIVRTEMGMLKLKVRSVNETQKRIERSEKLKV